MEGIGSAGQPKLAGALKKRPRKRGDPLKQEPAKKPKKEPRSPASIDDHAQGDATVCDCNSLVGRTVFKNFSTACKHYGFPGSHQVGSYGPKGTGIVRTYSNATPGKDIVLDNGEAFLYRLKDEKVRAQFKVNAQRKKAVRVFRKVSAGVVDLGEFRVEGFLPAKGGDQPETFGPTFVRFVRVGD